MKTQHKKRPQKKDSADNRDNAKLSREIENVIVTAGEWRYTVLGNPGI